jgi:hypothetical protein
VTLPDGQASAPITITPIDDAFDEDLETVTVTLAPGAGYTLGIPDSATVTITDDDTAGINVTPTSGLFTTEDGGIATFTMVLTSEPTADVRIGLASSDPTEGTVSPTLVILDPGNWVNPQLVTVTGVDDAVFDGNVGYTIITDPAASADFDYTGLDPADVAVTNLDDEVEMAIAASDPSASETGPDSGEFTVTRTGGTTGDLVVYFSVGGSATDGGDYWEIGGSVTIPDSAASTTITILPIDDLIDEDLETVTVTLAPGAGYTLGPFDSATVTIADDDTAGIVVTPTSGLVTTEAGGTATITMVLTSEPTADVRIGLTSSDPTEGTVSPTMVTFGPGTWNIPQPITVTGQDDALLDADVGYTIYTDPAFSADSNYVGLDPADVAVTNLDDEHPNIIVSPGSGLFTTETGGTATFTIVLNSPPSGIVTISLTSSDPSEGTVSPPWVTFTPLDWNIPQPVTVTGQDDAVLDGDIGYLIRCDASGGGYEGISTSVSLTNLDDEGAADVALFSDVLGILPITVLASVLVILPRRRNKNPNN